MQSCERLSNYLTSLNDHKELLSQLARDKVLNIFVEVVFNKILFIFLQPHPKQLHQLHHKIPFFATDSVLLILALLLNRICQQSNAGAMRLHCYQGVAAIAVHDALLPD